MKKLLSLSLLLLFSLGFAQEQKEINTEYEGGIDKSLFRRNEVRLNVLSTVYWGIEASYERILNDDIGVGVSFMKTYGLNEDEDTFNYLNYYISPYSRYYFGKKPAAGFFFEGFSMISNQKFRDNLNYKTTNKTLFGLGFGIGTKWVRRSGFNMEFNIGVGRNFNYSNNYDGSKFMGKFGLSIGYRFL